MKKLISFIVCSLCSILVFAQEGVNFQQLTFDEALAKAKTEKKLVFVDCYTVWCGPCKYMTEKIFPLEKAGEYFNARFVCVKYDMEKGEGKELAKKFKVKAFPSFYIIRPDGTIQHTIVGGGNTLDGFIQRVEKGLNGKSSLLYLTKMYEKGKMNKKQLMAYQEALTAAYDKEKAQKIAEELMVQLTEKDKLQKEFWSIFERQDCVVGSPDFNFVLANLRVFEKNIGKKKLDSYLYRAYDRAISAHISSRVEKGIPLLDDLKEEAAKLNIEKKEQLIAKIELAELIQTGNVSNLIALFEEKAATMVDNDVWTMISALRAISEKATKEEYDRMAALLEKIKENPANAEKNNFLSQYIQNYKEQAYVGTYFQDLTFEQALEKAKKNGKKLLIDCYTTWCGPCKYMTEKVFPQEELGDYLNPRFISVKYDMEKGEGPELKNKFGIRAYPTFVILNPDGTLCHQLIGGAQTPADFIERVEEAFDEHKAVGMLSKKYDDGERGKEFLLQYIEVLTKVRMTDRLNKVAEELYKSLTDEEKTSEKY